MRTPQSQPCREYSPTKVFQWFTKQKMPHHFNPERWNSLRKKGGYHHHYITPEWPRANQTVERFNLSMKDALQAATLKGSSMRDESQRFLQMYQSTPHNTIGASPHAAMHGGREMRTVLPLMTPRDHVLERIRDQQYKDKMRN